MMSDVDAFPMNSSLLAPLDDLKYKIWLYQVRKIFTIFLLSIIAYKYSAHLYFTKTFGKKNIFVF